MMIKAAIAAFMLHVAPVMAYPLVSTECKDDPEACVEAGKLEYVSIYGTIGDEDLEFVRMIDRLLPLDAPFPRVFLNSNGGAVRAAMSIGNLLHWYQATVESGSPVIPDATPQCTSACVLVAQSGYHRRLTHVGLHSPTKRVQTGKNVWENQSASAKTAAVIRRYMTDMGATKATIAIIEETKFDEIEDFFFDPTMPAADQEIVKLGFYSTEDQYFTSVGTPYPNTVTFTRRLTQMVNAAHYGSVQAMLDLALANMSYQPNEKPDFEAATYWLEMAAERGNAWSIHRLGYHYSYGLGVAKDEAKGAELYLKAAKLGLAASQNNVGWAYYKGVGMPASLPDAVYWITKAAEQGEPFAYGSLCQINGAKDQSQSVSAEAFKWCGLAVEHLIEGDAKDKAQVVYDEIMKAISPEDMAAGKVSTAE